MSLVTVCPKCHSEFEVTADQLKLHDGLVRCGQCAHVFDGFAHLKDNLPTLTRKVGAQSGSSATPLKPTVASHQVVPPQVPPEVAPASLAQPPTPEAISAIFASSAPSLPATDPQGRSSAAPAPVADDGLFIPSVDMRVSEASRSTNGRLEPALKANQASRQVTGGETESADTQSRARAQSHRDAAEPFIGTIQTTRSAGVSASGAESGQPSLRIMGESRLRGEDPSASGRTVPEFLEEDDEPEAGWRTSLWIIGSLLLALALIVQATVFMRNDIATAMPTLRPLLVQLCQPLGCEVGYVRQIDRIFIVGSELRQAPASAPDQSSRAYVLRLTLQNRASHAQPWPSLMLALNDASGTVVVRKAILPEQYLPTDLLNGPFEARQEVSLDVPIVVKDVAVSGYELVKFFP